jgi:hypothetical protein
LPETVVRNAGYTVNLQTSHINYLPKRGEGYRIRSPNEAGIRLQNILQHLRLRRGREVTGRFVLPDGSPAKNMTVMIGDKCNPGAPTGASFPRAKVRF